MLKKLFFLCLICFQALHSYGQFSSISISAMVKNSDDSALNFVNVQIHRLKDSAFVSGTISNEKGMFYLNNIGPGDYTITLIRGGFDTLKQNIFIGSLSEYIYLGVFKMNKRVNMFSNFSIKAKQSSTIDQPEKKTFTLENNVSQNGSSVLQSMQNLPGVTIQDGKILIRGNENIIILIDGKQTAITGVGGQASLDNIPASSVERVEIINNPSAKYDANGNAGIINIILKKGKKDGFHGKAGLSSGLGALWIKKDNLPVVGPQYQRTPKLNPSISLNYRTKRFNVFFQGDYFYNPTLNKNEFVTRQYDSGITIKQQTRRNRNTTIGTSRIGIDYTINTNNFLNFSTLFSSEKIVDNGEEPFFNGDLTEQKRLWLFTENEVKTTVTNIASFSHKYAQPGHVLNISGSYIFHRENERYDFKNILPSYTGFDAFHFISNEHVGEIYLDYTKPLKYGRVELGSKYRKRFIPTQMQFFPGFNSPLDSSAGGKASYLEDIPAIYGNYAFENKQWEIEAGLRIEYVNVKYVIPTAHPTYSSSNYQYFRPFPNFRLAYKANDENKFSISFNQRVDRPEEFDIRIFPKYDDAEIIKVGNPGLRPQFTSNIDLSHKFFRKNKSLLNSLYFRNTNGTITRVASTANNSNIIYSVMQNAGRSTQLGMELSYAIKLKKAININANASFYNSSIYAFNIENKYPVYSIIKVDKERMFSGNIKLNCLFNLKKGYTFQVSSIYLAPDLIPQGKIGQRFSLDLGAKKAIQKGKGELFANATDVLNTMVIKKDIKGNGFSYVSSDYYETQVVRIGYQYKF